jgi:hypothetical protein
LCFVVQQLKGGGWNWPNKSSGFHKIIGGQYCCAAEPASGTGLAPPATLPDQMHHQPPVADLPYLDHGGTVRCLHRKRPFLAYLSYLSYLSYLLGVLL